MEGCVDGQYWCGCMSQCAVVVFGVGEVEHQNTRGQATVKYKNQTGVHTIHIIIIMYSTV